MKEYERAAREYAESVQEDVNFDDAYSAFTACAKFMIKQLRSEEAEKHYRDTVDTEDSVIDVGPGIWADWLDRESEKK